MASFRSNGLAGRIRESLTAEDVARHYGFEPDRSGFIRCPFHRGDHTASLKLYPDQGGFHCFGCGAHGSVIDFVMQLFGLSFPQALLRLNLDFGLGLSADRPGPSEASRVLQERRRETEELESYRMEYRSRTVLYRYMWGALMSLDQGSFATMSPLYCAALRELPALDHWFETHPWR